MTPFLPVLGNVGNIDSQDPSIKYQNITKHIELNLFVMQLQQILKGLAQILFLISYLRLLLKSG